MQERNERLTNHVAGTSGHIGGQVGGEERRGELIASPKQLSRRVNSRASKSMRAL